MVKAALSGRRDDALRAFLLDPNMQARLDLEQTEQLLDEMLEANARWLPQFAGRSGSGFSLTPSTEAQAGRT